MCCFLITDMHALGMIWRISLSSDWSFISSLDFHSTEMHCFVSILCRPLSLHNADFLKGEFNELYSLRLCIFVSERERESIINVISIVNGTIYRFSIVEFPRNHSVFPLLFCTTTGKLKRKKKQPKWKKWIDCALMWMWSS